MFDVLLGGGKKIQRRRQGRLSQAALRQGSTITSRYSEPDARLCGRQARGVDNNTLVEEYNNGRLYRFSSDDRPLLKVLSIEAEGQLFIDMKDFTRKTFKVKEVAMADFMKEYFYKPILKAASKYKGRLGFVTDRKRHKAHQHAGGRGHILRRDRNLVNLARDIKQIVRGYRLQLFRKLPLHGSDQGIVEAVHKSFEDKGRPSKKA